MQNRKRDTDVQNRILDSVGEGEGGMLRERLLNCSVFEYSLTLILFSSSLELWCYDWWYFYYCHTNSWGSILFSYFQKKKAKIRNTDFCCSDWVNSIDMSSSSLILFSITSLPLLNSSNKLFLCVSDILSFSSLFHLVLFCKFHFFAEVLYFFICFKRICYWCCVTFVWLLSNLCQIISTSTSYSSPSWCQLIVFFKQVVIF